MRILSIFLLVLFSAFTDFTEVCGTYSGEKYDYIAELKLYDDSAFKYTALREYPFEVSEGTWTLNGDTVTITSSPCTDPGALNHGPVRTYIMFTNQKYLFKKNALIPISDKNKLVKSETLLKEK